MAIHSKIAGFRGKSGYFRLRASGYWLGTVLRPPNAKNQASNDFGRASNGKL